jgi:hypothetical protein
MLWLTFLRISDIRERVWHGSRVRSASKFIGQRLAHQCPDPECISDEFIHIPDNPYDEVRAREDEEIRRRQIDGRRADIWRGGFLWKGMKSRSDRMRSVPMPEFLQVCFRLPSGGGPALDARATGSHDAAGGLPV